jgi:hypothetical protein
MNSSLYESSKVADDLTINSFEETKIIAKSYGSNFSLELKMWNLLKVSLFS